MPILYETFAKSPTVTVTAVKVKKPTEMKIYLWDEAEKERMEGKSLPVGTKIIVATALFTEPWYTTVSGKRHIVYHRVNTGAWEKIADKVAPENYINVPYTLAVEGKHSFYAEFPGDEDYEGCAAQVPG